MSDVLIAKEEVLRWWSSERQRVRSECTRFREQLLLEYEPKIDRMSMRELLSVGNAVKSLKADVQSQCKAFQSELEASLKAELEASQKEVEDVNIESGAKPSEVGMATTLGVVGAGSVGTAVAATGIATTVTPTSLFFGLLTTGSVTLFSWPVFIAAGSAAVLGACVFHAGKNRLRKVTRTRMKNAFRQGLDAYLFGRGTPKTAKALLPVIDERLDSIRDARLAGLKEGFQ